MNRIRLSKINLLVIDVDGTMTDGGIYYNESGDEIKKFCTKDAAGYFTAHACGIKLMVLTGRECKATTRRMSEMGFDYIIQDVKDKYHFLQDFMSENGLTSENIGYIGDDLNDLEGMSISAFSGCPEDACDEIKKVCEYISPVKGGYGAVRDIISHLLKERGEWEKAYRQVYFH